MATKKKKKVTKKKVTKKKTSKKKASKKKAAKRVLRNIASGRRRARRFLVEEGESCVLPTAESEVAIPHLEQVANRNNGLTKEIVYREACREDSPLHGLSIFEWNRTRATFKYNMNAAGRLISSITIKVIDSNQIHEGCRVRQYIRTKIVDGTDPAEPTGNTGYIPIDRIISDSERIRRYCLNFGQRLEALCIREEGWTQLTPYTDQVKSIARRIITEFEDDSSPTISVVAK